MVEFSSGVSCAQSYSRTTLNDSGDVVFKPTLCEQRQCCILQALTNYKWCAQIVKVAEFGVAEMNFLHHLRRAENIQHILQIGADKATLEMKSSTADPLPPSGNYFRMRQNPLRIEIHCGSIAVPSQVLQNTDAVVAMELIHHLSDKELSDAIVNIFGSIKPKLVVFSTPNAEYNVHGIIERGHKFQFSRQQFKQWCLKIAQSFPNYSVDIVGVGQPLSAYTSVGCATQIAIFARHDLLGKPLVESTQQNLQFGLADDVFELVKIVDHPFQGVPTLEKLIQQSHKLARF